MLASVPRVGSWIGAVRRPFSTIFRIIREINEQGTTILLVEQNARMALAAARTGYVLETGKVVLSDSGPALLDNPEVRKAYLGQD